MTAVALHLPRAQLVCRLQLEAWRALWHQPLSCDRTTSGSYCCGVALRETPLPDPNE